MTNGYYTTLYRAKRHKNNTKYNKTKLNSNKKSTQIRFLSQVILLTQK